MVNKSIISVKELHKKARKLTLDEIKKGIREHTYTSVIDLYYKVFWSLFKQMLEDGKDITARGAFTLKIRVRQKGFKGDKKSPIVCGYVVLSRGIKKKIVFNKKGYVVEEQKESGSGERKAFAK